MIEQANRWHSRLLPNTCPKTRVRDAQAPQPSWIKELRTRNLKSTRKGLQQEDDPKGWNR